MNIQKLMKQAQQMQAKMQADMEKAQAELADERLEGSSGGGLVTVVVNGHKELVSISIKPAAVDPNDIETLEDLVFAAMQSALNAAQARNDEVMAQVQGGMGLPPGMEGMFG